jgi:hypothetical protein
MAPKSKQNTIAPSPGGGDLLRRRLIEELKSQVGHVELVFDLEKSRRRPVVAKRVGRKPRS